MLFDVDEAPEGWAYTPVTEVTWMRRARCATGEVDVEAWHACDAPRDADESQRMGNLGEVVDPHAVAMAKRVCSQCPVQITCLNYALSQDERRGVWGGLDALQRRRLARRHDVRPPCGTHKGYQAHGKRGEEPCDDCRRAHREYVAAWRVGATEVEAS